MGANILLPAEADRHKMKKCNLKTMMSIVILIFMSGEARSDFNTLETEHLRLIYFGGAHNFIVPHVARCFENSYNFHQNLYDYDSPEKITVFLHDLSDYGNAGAGTIPKNHISKY